MTLSTRPSVLALLVLGALPSFAQAQTPVSVGERFEVPSAVLGETRHVLVHLPASYERSTASYPVLYLTDGETQFVHTAATADFLARAGRIPELIVVGITNTDRTRDLTPTHVTTGLPGRPDAFAHSGGGERFLSFVERELVPWVEGRYRTAPYRLFAGYSLGGLFATHAFFARPALFDAVVAVSPELNWDRNLPLSWAEHYLGSPVDHPRMLVVVIGDEPDLLPPYERLKAMLAATPARNLRTHLERMAEEDHGSIVLATHYLALRRIFAHWALPRDRMTERFTGTMDDVRRHYHRIADELGWAPTPAEALVNALGYGALADHRLDAALDFFRFNVEAYAASANVHDSYGEGLEAAGRLAEAAQSYRRAIAAGERSADPNLEAFRHHLARVQPPAR